jgi:serine/threonine-protein kinase
LNEELRRQVAERSRDLAKAITTARSIVPAAAPELMPGMLFEQRYRIVERLGEGGMGLVYRIERISDGRELALKVMNGAVTASAAARFAREAEIAARVHHPGLVSVVDVGVSAGNAVYFAMELVRGGSLEERRDLFGNLDWAVAILRQIAEALAALHDSGVVHRDLKPANVLLVDADPERPQIKLADFGIARLGAPELEDTAPASGSARTQPLERTAGLTRTGALMGTPLYMAPELAHGAQRARGSADMFAFGVLAAELLGRQYPFVVPPLYDALTGRPMQPPARGLLARIPRELRAMVESCLAEDPQARPRAAEVVKLLASSPVARAAHAGMRCA